MHKKNQGDYGESLVIAQALKHQCNVFTDFGDNSKIDLIIEDKFGTLYKVQVKCVGRERKSPNASKLYLYKSGPNYQFSYSDVSIDFFAVVDLQTAKIAWITKQQTVDRSHVMLLVHGEVKQRNQRKFDDFTRFPFNLGP